jgi:hypothetical protein
MDVEKQTPSIDLSTVPSSDLAREMSRRSRLGNAARRVLRPCKFCTLPFGARDMQAHLHVCTMKTRRPRKRKESEEVNGD